MSSARRLNPNAPALALFSRRVVIMRGLVAARGGRTHLTDDDDSDDGTPSHPPLLADEDGNPISIDGDRVVIE